jgi:hypothetical protein
MGFYENRILPYLVHLSMRQETLSAYRRRVVPSAQGRVLEIGIGSGPNRPFYADAAMQIVGLDPSAQLLTMARADHQRTATRSIELIEGSAETIPLEDKSVDTVVTTWTLRTSPRCDCRVARDATRAQALRRSAWDSNSGASDNPLMSKALVRCRTAAQASPARNGPSI